MLGTWKETEEREYLSGKDENPPKEIDVCVSVTLHKTFKLKVNDYTIIDEYVDEDGRYCCEEDYSTCDLYSAAREQLDIDNPSEKNGWTEDEFEVIIDK
jgi:hypothetical protein